MAIDPGIALAAVAGPTPPPAAAPAPAQQVATTTVMLCLDSEEGADWPPYPAETVAAVLLAPGLAEITESPWFALGVSVGDVLQVRPDSHGLIAGPVVCRGGHTTIALITAADPELTPVVDALRAFGCTVRRTSRPSMISVDVPEGVPLVPVIHLLDAAESATCAYTVACAQHRISDLA